MAEHDIEAHAAPAAAPTAPTDEARALEDARWRMLRRRTVVLLDNLRRDFLRAGGSPLKQHERLMTRLRGAALRCETPQALATDMMRGLQITSPSNWTCSAVVDLCRGVEELPAPGPWLDLLTDEAGLLIAYVQAGKAEWERDLGTAEDE